MRLGGSFGADASQLNSAEACWASLVMSTRTGPGRPLLAIRKASRMVRATSSAFVTTTLCLVMGMVMPVISISWNASEPRTLLLTWPVMQTTGEESSMAVAIPVTMFVAPGPDVAMATSGPGATNMVTGIATAMLDSSPVVCITGQVSSKVLGTDAFQEIDITGITMPITKHNVVVTKAEDVARTLREAFLIANSGRPGPVLVDITKDAQQASAEFNWEASAPKLPPKRQRNNHDQAEFDRAVDMRFDDRVTGDLRTYAKSARKIHIEIDRAEINKNVKVDAALVGDAREVLERLTPHIETREHTSWVRHITELKGDSAVRDIQSLPDSGHLYAAHVINDLWKETRGEAIIVTDVGQHQMWEAQYYHHNRPRTLITSGGLGTMGFALPAAIGAKFAKPDSEVWVVAGDGGFQMTMSELATIVQEKINIKIAIINNGFLGMVRQWQEFFYDKRYVATPLVAPDFAALANAFGIRGERITKRAE